MQLKVKKLVPEAVLPKKANPSDSGFDIVAIDDGVWSEGQMYIQYSAGISIEPPEGYDVQLRARSSISNYDLMLCNGVGTIDQGYRGSIVCRFKPVYRDNPASDGELLLPLKLYKKGDKIAQLILSKVETFEVVEINELGSTDRGSGGFGSTDKK